MALSKSLNLIGDRVMIEPMDVPQATLIVMPDTVKSEQDIRTGIVVKVGPGYLVQHSPETSADEWLKEASGEAHKPRYLPMQVRVGDFVLYAHKACAEVLVGTKKYAIGPQAAILAYDSEYWTA
jgi:chaperonin GroES